MASGRQRAGNDFRPMMRWIVAAAAAMVAAALACLMATGDLTADMAMATVLGVFFSVLLGAGLMAASCLRDKSGHDRDASDATRERDRRGWPSAASVRAPAPRPRAHRG